MCVRACVYVRVCGLNRITQAKENSIHVVTMTAGKGHKKAVKSIMFGAIYDVIPFVYEWLMK